MCRLVAFLLKSMVEYFDLQYLCYFSICYSQSCVNVRSGMRQESVRLGRAGVVKWVLYYLFLLCLRYSRECGDKSTCGGIVQDFVWEKSRDTETELRVVYPSPKYIVNLLGKRRLVCVISEGCGNNYCQTKLFLLVNFLVLFWHWDFC